MVNNKNVRIKKFLSGMLDIFTYIGLSILLFETKHYIIFSIILILFLILTAYEIWGGDNAES